MQKFMIITHMYYILRILYPNFLLKCYNSLMKFPTMRMFSESFTKDIFSDLVFCLHSSIFFIQLISSLTPSCLTPKQAMPCNIHVSLYSSQYNDDDDVL